MKLKSAKSNTRARDKGMTLVELLVVLSLTGMVFYGVMTQFTTSVQTSHDHDVKIATVLEAQAILQTIGSEVRMLGNGVPFDQPNFTIGEVGLIDLTRTYPLSLATSTTSNISFRLNESGEVYLLAADFDPGASTTVTLTSVNGITAGDPVYLSNSVVSGEDGMYAEVQSVNTGSNTVTLTNMDYINAPEFDVGSIFEVVPLITYANTGSGITRTSGASTVTLGAGSTMTLEYLDNNNATMTPPLTEANVVAAFRAVKVTVNLTSSSSLRDGTNFSAIVEQTYGIRNLNYLY